MATQIDNAGDFGLRVHNPSRKQHRILPVDISLNSAAFLITVGKATLAPPYRVENRSAAQSRKTGLLLSDCIWALSDWNIPI